MPFPSRTRVVVTLAAPTPSTLRAEVRGEIDIATVDQFTDGLAAVRERPFAELVVDLTGVDFLAAVAVPVLVDLGEQARRRGAAVEIRCDPQGIVARTLELCGVPTAAP